MSQIRLLSAFAALLLLCAGAARVHAGQVDAPIAESAEGRQAAQVLVMLRLPPPHVRGGAASAGAYGDAAAGAARRRLAQALARRLGMQVAESWPMPMLGVDCFVFDLPPGMAADQAVAQLSRDKAVLWAQRMNYYRGRGASGDPLYLAQPAARTWQLATLHRYATGRGVRVAVIDSKVETTHPDLGGQFVADRDFVGNGAAAGAERHGTGVAGVIAARANNGIGIVGVAPDARLMALRACWETGGANPAICSSFTLARAIQFAIEHDAHILNFSLSGPPDQLLDRLLDIALRRGMAVVAAYDGDAQQGGFPALKPGVIAVADESLPRWPASVYRAPGRDILTTQPGGRWYVVNGSSYAVAHVTGLLALAHGQRRGGWPRIALKGGRVVDACATVMADEGPRDCAGAGQAGAATRAGH